MELYDAIKEMRRLTALGQHFSFTFMSYYRSKQTSSGIVEVPRAKLRKRDRIENNQNAEIMEEYLDLSDNHAKEFYHCCLMFFNGIRIKLV